MFNKDTLAKLTDAELADRYGQCDLKLRQLTEWSPLLDRLDEVMQAIREEQARRKEAAYGERCTD
jgi:hypothetical protein